MQYSQINKFLVWFRTMEITWHHGVFPVWEMGNSVCRLLYLKTEFRDLTMRFENNINARFKPLTRNLKLKEFCFNFLTEESLKFRIQHFGLYKYLRCQWNCSNNDGNFDVRFISCPRQIDSHLDMIFRFDDVQSPI